MPLTAALLSLLPAEGAPPLSWADVVEALEAAGLAPDAGDLDVTLRLLGAEHPASRPGAMLYALPVVPPDDRTTTGGGRARGISKSLTTASAAAQGVLLFQAPPPVQAPFSESR